LELDREAIKAEVKPSTLIVHENVSKHAEAAIGADVELSSIDWQHVSDLKNWLGSEHVLGERKLPPCSKATIKKSIVTLKAAFNRAIERELIDTNPFAKEKLAKVQPKQKRIYSLAEVDAMVEAASGIWWKAFIRVAITTGLRFGEILNLTWADIDSDAAQITVSAKRPGQFKVGDRSYPRLAFSTKSHRERNVPLDREAENLLQRLKAKSGGSIYPFISLQRLALLAATEDVQQEIPSPKLINNVIRDFKALQIQARANLAKKQDVKLDKIIWEIGSPHDLRKSFATHMAKIIPMNDLRQLLGHASIVTTADFYAAVGDDVVTCEICLGLRTVAHPHATATLTIAPRRINHASLNRRRFIDVFYASASIFALDDSITIVCPVYASFSPLVRHWPPQSSH